MTSRRAVNNPSNRNGDTRERGASSRPQATDTLDPRQMSLTALAARCAAESEHFYRGRSYDCRFAYELFRRAVVEQDEMAWQYVYMHYGPLVESWVRRSGAFAGSGESGEFFVSAAFTKFWRAVTPERFATFPTLAPLLHYLQLCAGSVVIDSVRAQSWAEMVPEEGLPAGQTPHVSPDEQAIEQVSRLEFWGVVERLLNSEAERFAVIGSYIMAMKPGEICDARPDLFASANDVYNVKRNVLSRLGRNPELRSMLG